MIVVVFKRFVENWKLKGCWNFEWLKKMINVNINIVMLFFIGLEYNFEKYIIGEVKILDFMKNFYDFDVSEI